jgi:hypothetical protein
VLLPPPHTAEQELTDHTIGLVCSASDRSLPEGVSRTVCSPECTHGKASRFHCASTLLVGWLVGLFKSPLFLGNAFFEKVRLGPFRGLVA